MNQEANYGQMLRWPSEVSPERKAQLHEREVRFLEAACQEGYTPYLYQPGDLGAAANERTGSIIERGRKAWEVVLGRAEERALSAYVDDFDCAAEAVLGWLRGAETADILPRLQGHLVKMPGASRSFVVHDQA